MVGGTYSVSHQLSSIYNKTEQSLGQVMTRIASGKRIQRPGDDFAGYVRAQSLGQDAAAIDRIKQNLIEARGGASAAEEAANTILDKVSELKSLAKQYASATADEQVGLSARFTAVKADITDIRDNTQYEGNTVFDPAAPTTFATVDLALPGDAANNMTLGYLAADVITDVNLTAAVITDESSVDATLTAATNMLTLAEGFDTKIDMNLNMMDTIKQSKLAAQSAITDIDDVEELAKAVDLQVRQSAAVSMMAQANVSRQGLLRLYM